MILYLNGRPMPEYNDFQEIISPNAPRNTTLDGTLYVDFINNRRTWQATWEYMTAANYSILRTIYDAQFSSAAFVNLYIPDLNIIRPAYITLNERKIIWNNKYVNNVVLTIEEQHAIS